MARSFLEAVEHRRTVYTIDQGMPVSHERVQEIIEKALLHTPTTFNSQGGRAAILFGEHHRRLWRIVLDILCPIVPEADFPTTRKKIDGFAAGAGTVLFFEDQEVVQELQERYALYADKFPVFSSHSSGMLQMIAWTALEDAGFGCSLQHYNPLIDSRVHEEWSLPGSWELVSQLVFGAPTDWPEEKEFLPLDERMKVFQ